MNGHPVDVLAYHDALIASHRALSADAYHAQELPKAEAAREAVAELVGAAARVIRAFEAYGKAQGIVAEHRYRQECESAMVAQKAALANIGSAP